MAAMFEELRGIQEFELNGMKGLRYEDRILLEPEYVLISVHIPGENASSLLPNIVVVAKDKYWDYEIFQYDPKNLTLVSRWKAPRTEFLTPWKLDGNKIVNEDWGLYYPSGEKV